MMHQHPLMVIAHQVSHLLLRAALPALLLRQVLSMLDDAFAEPPELSIEHDLYQNLEDHMSQLVNLLGLIDRAPMLAHNLT